MAYEIADCKNVIFRDVSVSDIIEALASKGITLDVEWDMVGIGALACTDTIKVMLFEKKKK
jgi:hypothetical protein